MQRETALALLGVVVFIVLALVAYATQLFRTPEPTVPLPPPSSQEVTSPTPSSPPSLAMPVPPPPSGSRPQNLVAVPSVPETPPINFGKASQPAPSLASSPTVLPPVPGVGTPPPPPPISANEPLLNEAVRWAKAMVEQERPRWQIRLFQAEDPQLGREGFTFAIDSDRLEIRALTPVGWLYGLLEIADRLRNGDEIPSQWRWQPPLSDRGWIEAVSSFVSPRWSITRLRTAIRDRLRALAWQRFNVWVLESNGQEPFLPALLNEARTLAPLYGVRVVLWAPMTPTIRIWHSQGGTVVSATPSQPNAILMATDPTVTRWLGTQTVALPLQDGHLFAPTLPPFVKTVPRRWRSRLILVGGPEGAHEGLFWFDPEWAQALVQAMRDEGIGGLWLRVRSVPISWGATAFCIALRDPDTNAERFWAQRWSRQWGSSARLWLTAFREASRIMPDLLMLLGTAPEEGHPFRPQWGVPLPLFFSRRPLPPDWGISVLSVVDTLRETGALERVSALTAVEIAQRLHQRADTVLSTLSRLPDPTNPQWRQAKQAATLNGWLGKHFAFKVEAALAWGLFEAGDQEAGTAAVLALENAVQAWRQAATAANALYGPVNEWARRLPWWQQEVRQYQARRAQAPSLP